MLQWIRLSVRRQSVVVHYLAEEVTQEVFVRVYHALASYRGESKFSTWIYRITFNLAVDLKKHMRYRVPHINEQVLLAKASSQTDPLGQLESIQRSRECVMRDHPNEQIDKEMDRELQRCFAGVPPHLPSTDFDQKLYKALHPPSLLSRKSRALLASYALAALAISVCLLRSEYIGWTLVNLAVIISVAIAYVVNSLRLLRYLIRL